MARIFRSDAGKALIHGQYRSVLDRWPVPRRELRIPTCQGETFVVDCGPEGAPPVILPHGGATTSAMWVRSVRAWAASFRLYAIDIIGEPGFSAPSRPALAALTRKTKIVCLAAAGHGLTDQTRTVLEFLSAETAIA